MSYPFHRIENGAPRQGTFLPRVLRPVWVDLAQLACSYTALTALDGGDLRVKAAQETIATRKAVGSRKYRVATCYKVVVRM